MRSTLRLLALLLTLGLFAAACGDDSDDTAPAQSAETTAAEAETTETTAATPETTEAPATTTADATPDPMASRMPQPIKAEGRSHGRRRWAWAWRSVPNTWTKTVSPPATLATGL